MVGSSEAARQTGPGPGRWLGFRHAESVSRPTPSRGFNPRQESTRGSVGAGKR